MNIPADIVDRKTSADTIFDSLYEEIVSLRLLPGTKISETEIAGQFGVSRQPVRDAFSRLGTIGFLLIRPQKATEVQKFGNAKITTARFVRAAIEVEVLARAAKLWNGSMAGRFEENLAEQDKAVATYDVDAFHKLDYDFHRLLCISADVAVAFEAIMENKAHIDRLCVLSMMDSDAMAHLVRDHRKIYDAVQKGDAEQGQLAMRTHLSRLDATIERVRETHPDYFV